MERLPGNIIGMKFGTLTVLKLLDERTKDGQRRWVCLCDCGGSRIISKSQLRKWVVISCGCISENGRFKETHGLTKANTIPEFYWIWSGMKERCLNPKHDAYHRYGGRGITVCGEWINDFPAFSDWVKKNGYKKGLEMDREDNDRGYSPSNCRFVNRAVNARNSSNAKLDDIKVKQIKSLLKSSTLKQRQIAEMFDIGREAISKINNGTTWEGV